MDREVRREVRSLKRELQRKEKALAETVALLTLSNLPAAGRPGDLWGRARTHDQHPGSPACGITD